MPCCQRFLPGPEAGALNRMSSQSSGANTNVLSIACSGAWMMPTPSVTALLRPQPSASISCTAQAAVSPTVDNLLPIRETLLAPSLSIIEFYFLRSYDGFQLPPSLASYYSLRCSQCTSKCAFERAPRSTWWRWWCGERGQIAFVGGKRSLHRYLAQLSWVIFVMTLVRTESSIFSTLVHLLIASR